MKCEGIEIIWVFERLFGEIGLRRRQGALKVGDGFAFAFVQLRFNVVRNPQSFSVAPGMMPNLARVEEFFARMTFKASGAAGHSCCKQFSTRQILNAKFPEPGGGSTVEQSDYED